MTKLAGPVLLDATITHGIEGSERKSTGRVRVCPNPWGDGNIIQMENTPDNWMAGWGLATLRGEDKWSRGRCGDSLYIDAGQRWMVWGLTAVLAECDAKGY